MGSAFWTMIAPHTYVAHEASAPGPAVARTCGASSKQRTKRGVVGAWLTRSDRGQTDSLTRQNQAVAARRRLALRGDTALTLAYTSSHYCCDVSLAHVPRGCPPPPPLSCAPYTTKYPTDHKCQPQRCCSGSGSPRTAGTSTPGCGISTTSPRPSSIASARRRPGRWR